LLGLILLAAAPAPRAKAELAWKFEPGQTLRYEFSQKTDQTVSDASNEERRLTELRIGTTWRVASVADDGTAEIAMTVDHVHAEVKAGPTTTLYDSREKKAEGPGASLLGDLYGATVGASYRLKIDPRGQISVVGFPDKVEDVQRGSLSPSLADGGSLFSDKGVKNLLGQVIPLLPEGPVADGQTWVGELEFPAGELRMKVATTYSLAAIEGDLARLSGAIVTGVQPRQSSPLRIAVKGQSGKGEYRFDTKAGRLDDSKIEQTVELSLEATGRATTVTMTINLGMTRQDAAP
jgi:hypothetical protein